MIVTFFGDSTCIGDAWCMCGMMLFSISRLEIVERVDSECRSFDFGGMFGGCELELAFARGLR